MIANAERSNNACNSVYHFFNWATLGNVDLINGALNPKETLSKEHWLNSITLASVFFWGKSAADSFSKASISESVEEIVESYIKDEVKGGSNLSTKISCEMENKILEGQRKSPTKNQIIGGHSPNINNNNIFAVEELSVNPDGTKNIKFIKDLQDGSISKIKKSTIFPDSWNESKIIDSIKNVGDSPAIAVRQRDGATFQRQIIDGVEIDVIKLGDDVISGYPTGKVNAPKPSGF